MVMKMAIKKYKNIFGKPINVNTKERVPEEVFEEDNTRREIKNLVRHKYIEETDEEISVIPDEESEVNESGEQTD